MAAGLAPSSISRIVVLRANGLGDYLFALPALHAIRRRFSAAEITYVGLPWHERELAERPEPVDRFVAAPPWPGVSLPDTAEPPSVAGRARIDRFLEQMREQRFDLGVQMHGGGRNTNPFLLAMRPAFTAGTRTPDADPLDRSLPYDYFQHEVARWNAVAALVGADTGELTPSWRVTPEELAASRALLPPDGRPLAVVNPGAGDARRRWRPERFAAVAGRMADAGARVVVTGGPEERELAENLAEGVAAPVESVAGETSLGVLGALFSRASLVVSADSGPLHLARAVGAPTVGVYWCGNVINAGPLDASRHRAAISWRLVCPVCGLDCMQGRCEHDASFVDDVGVGEVAEKAAELLGRHYREDR
jgi:ADP-heptose:LPS heptosyltransferase